MSTNNGGELELELGTNVGSEEHGGSSADLVSPKFYRRLPTTPRLHLL